MKQTANAGPKPFAYHPEPNMNYQFSRIVNICGGDHYESVQAAARIHSIEDWIAEFTLLADKAKKEGRIREYTAYTRAVNFYLDTKNPRKKETYREYLSQINALIKRDFDEGRIKRMEVPYQNGFLPVWHMEAAGESKMDKTNSVPKVLFHLGYDSLKEELLPALRLFAKQGCDTWLFEGPGQGEALYECGIPMTHQWEKPVKAVLDHLKLDDVTLVGLSLGGYLAPRAAMHEKRIKRVVAWGVIYDFFEVVSTRRGKFLFYFLKFCMAIKAKFLLNTIIKKKMRSDSYTGWGVSHGMTVFGVDEPWSYFKELAHYSLKRDSGKITQDFLLMGSSGDHFIPRDYLAKQVDALTNVRSLTARLFTDKENAGDHVQFGNLPLAVRCITDWIKERCGS